MLLIAAIALFSPALLAAELAAHPALPARPKLVVVISIDQFRADYLTRFEDLYLPARAPGRVGGFRYLMETGAWETSTFHDHVPLYTGPGHAVLLTGAPPYKSGIIDNGWYDRATKKERYCVEDAASPLVGTTSGKMGISPATLLVTTVGDELQMAEGGRAKVWGIGFKDRGAVLMAGHLANGVLWFEDETANWIGSRYYFKSGELPGWVAAWNARKLIDARFGTTWTPSVPASALARSWSAKNTTVSDYNHLGKVFPHRIDGGLTGPGKAFYRAFATTPFANDFVFDTARELISRERLGQDEIPDLLAISLSTNDYIGHVFGPDSEEVLDACVRTDRALSDFLNALDRLIPGGLARVTIVLSADHGVAPNAALLKEAGIPAGGYDDEAIGKAAEAALDRVFGEGDWTEAYTGGGLYLKHETAEARKVDLARAEEVAAEAMASQPGVYAAYTRAQILSGAMPHTEIAASVSRSFHPKISGDVVIVADPQWTYAEALSGATHGSPYVYDTKVPVLFAGAGIRKGRFAERASTLDVAPTLSELLGILSPSGCEGRVLGNALTSLSPADGRPAAAVH